MVFKGEKGYSLYTMKLFFILTSSLFLCLGAQAKFPGGRTDQDGQ